MKDSIQLFLVHMTEHAHYQDFLDLIASHRPSVPLFDANKDNVEMWKQKSGQQQGYDLLASLMKIKFGD